MSTPQHRRLRFTSLNSLIPNMLTTLALCAGLTSVRFALDERWEMAVVAILAAGVLDGLDGRMARLLNSTSRFGAELDSLSEDRKSTRLNSSHVKISYAVFCLKNKK